MKKFKTYCLSLGLFLLLSVTFLSGCGKKDTNVDASALLDALLTQVTFDTELSQVDKNAELYFPDLPEGATLTLYTGSGYFADEVALITLADKNDGKDATAVVEKHVQELRNQFANYMPEELGKIDNAVIRQLGNHIFLCISNDYANANDILSNKNTSASKKETEVLVEENTDSSLADIESETLPTEEDTLQAESENTDMENIDTENTTVEENIEDYPVLLSESGTYHDYGNGVYKVDGIAYEAFFYVDSSAQIYADIINTAADGVSSETDVYCIPIPTAIGIVFPDDVKEKLPEYTNQNESIQNIFSKISDNVMKVNPYSNLMKHRDEYLYFKTDFHWNGPGAYYAYEAFCQKKGISPIPMEERKEHVFDGFLGALYWNSCGEDPELKENTDVIYAYSPKSETATLQIENDGQMLEWDIITDVSDWKASVKYSTFAGADAPLAVFQNPEVTDGSVCVVVKESFGNALLPFLVDHYSTIYEIDYRHWSGNIMDFATEKGADDLIFANNLAMFSSNYSLGKLNSVVN